MESTKPTLNEAENGNKSKPLLSSRLFKFRAMTHKNNVMVCGDLINTPDNENRIIWFDEKHTYNERVQSSTIGQFTGLQDLNGVDIYEGDILQIGEDLTELVKWIDEDNWMQEKCPINGFVNHQSIYKIKPLIIGNIFENPELL